MRPPSHPQHNPHAPITRRFAIVAVDVRAQAAGFGRRFHLANYGHEAYIAMFDDLDRLRRRPVLARLLSHYAQLSSVDRGAWHDRCMILEGVDTKGLTRLHGELIAFGRIEQNTGQTLQSEIGAIAKCYRITGSGLRASRRVGNAPRSDSHYMDEAA